MKEIDFLPASFHEVSLQRHVNRRNLIYSCAVLTGLAVFHGLTRSHIRSAEASLAVVQESAAMRTTQRSRLTALRVTKSALQVKSELLASLADDAPLEVIIAEINRLMGPAMALRSLALQTLPVAAPADKQEPDTVRERGRTEGVLHGVAPSDVEVGTFFGRLSSCPLFEDVRLTYSREAQQSGRSMREFESKFTVRRVVFAGSASSPSTTGAKP